MSSFDWLLIGHLIGDFLLQTSWMANHKVKRYLPLVTHAFIYSIVIAFIAQMGFGGLSWLSIAVIFVSHIILDQRKFVQWWLRVIMGIKKTQIPWLQITVDQIFHLLVLVIALYL